MTNKEEMSYLTAPLREVAQHHLQPEETVLTAIYAHHTILHDHAGWLWLTGYRQVHHPARAFVLTPERVLILEDPTDPAASTANREYLFASCSLNRVMLFELRSHLLDCALTLVMATPGGPERITIQYSGVSEHACAGRRSATSSLHTARRDLRAGACDLVLGLASGPGRAGDETEEHCHALPGLW
jgi:hypothetical protein